MKVYVDINLLWQLQSKVLGTTNDFNSIGFNNDIYKHHFESIFMMILPFINKSSCLYL